MAAQQNQQQQQQTEKLIEEMLGFLDSSSSDEDEEGNNNTNSATADNAEANGQAAAPVVHTPSAQVTGAPPQQNRPQKKEKKAKISIAKELKKVKAQFPIWVTKEIVSSCKKLNDPVWREDRIQGKDAAAAAAANENDWNTKLEWNCRRRSNAYVQEVHRSIFSDTSCHPPNGSPDYFQAAQNYAIYGKDFLDFPENLTPLLNTGCGDKSVNAPPEIVPFVSGCGYGNGLYPTPIAPEMATGIGYSQFGQQSATSAATNAATAAYYQMCNGMQTRPGTGSTTYGMFMGNKVTYVAAAPTPQPLVYNQHSSTTTNFISNSLANAALASSPAILYSNPMLTTTTQQYLNTFFKETQYLSGGTAQATTVGTTTGIYERLVYAQMLQQQIYHQTQQQAAAMAAMFQHKSRSTRASNGGAGGATPQVPPPIPTQQQQPTSSMQATGLNLCGRQAAMSATNASDLLAVNKATSVADVDIAVPLPLAD